MTVTREERKLGRRQPLSVPGKYLSLTTSRRDGTPVSTPVWFVEEDGRLFVTTAADSYKAKRLRRNPAAMVASCAARGVPKGDAIPVEVEFLPPDAHARVDRLMAEKYRVDWRNGRRTELLAVRPEPFSAPLGRSAPGRRRPGLLRVYHNAGSARPPMPADGRRGTLALAS